MKKHLSALALCASSCSLGTALAAEGQVTIAPGLQWMNYDNELGHKSETRHFIGLGYDITSRISAELSVADLNPDTRDGREIDQDLWRVDVFYGLDFDLGSFEPFVVGGAGTSKLDGENNAIWDIGAGVSLPLGDRLSWRTSVRNYYFSGRNTEDQDLGIDTALVYRLGARGPAPRRAESPRPTVQEAAATPRVQPADADRDGVADALDRCEDTPMSYAVDASGCPIAVEELARVELLVNFDFDKSEVKPQYYGEIESVARFMQQYPDVVVELEGHTDARGTDAYNLDLSQRRAEAVMRELVERFSVQASRVSARGFGESQPVASNDSESGRAQNRRVITVVVKTLQRYRAR